MSDAFLTLAYTDKGLTCFLAPRWTPDGERNAIHLMRLKDKLGDRANASAEIEYHGAYAEIVGEEGRGVPTIIEMVHATRFDCILAPAAYMRQAIANALWHAAHRTAFQRKLIDQPLSAACLPIWRSSRRPQPRSPSASQRASMKAPTRARRRSLERLTERLNR